MPYEVKGQCIYKRDTGKKVGCTKGSVKKYLAALHANVNESEDDLEWVDTEINLNGIHFVFNPPISNIEDYITFIETLSELDPTIRWSGFLENHGYLKDYMPKSINHLGNVIQSSKIYTDAFIDFNGELTMMKPWDPKEGYDIGGRYNQVNGWDFIKKPKNVNESTELNESKYPGIVKKPKIGDRVIVNGWYGEEGPGLYDIVLKFDNDTGTVVDVDIAGGLSFRDGGEVIISFDRWRLPAEDDGGFEYIDDSCRGRKCMQFSNLSNEDYDFSIKPLSKDMDVKDFDAFENLYESEENDLEWAQDIVNTEYIDITKDKKQIDLLKVGSVISVTGDWESLTFNNDRATIIENSNKTNSFLLKFDRVVESEDDTSHCGHHEHYKICECEDNNVVGKCWYTDILQMDKVIWYPYETLNESEAEEFDWARDIISLDLGFDDLKIGDVVKLKDNSGYWLVTNIYMTDPNMTGGRPPEKRIKFISVHSNGKANFSYFRNSSLEYTKTPINSFNFFELVDRKGINESEENDLEWAEETIKQTPMVNVTYVDAFTGERGSLDGSSWLRHILEWNASSQSKGGTKIYAMNGTVSPEYRMSFYIERGGYVELTNKVSYYSHESPNGPPRLELSTAWDSHSGAWDMVKKFLLTLQVRIPLNESEENDLEWAQDLVSNVDTEINYSSFKKDGKLLPDGAILKISGEQDELEFNNQECKVIKFMDVEYGTVRYLCVFPEAIHNRYVGTHCGSIEDEEKCHCLEKGGSDGRCWEIEMDHMSEVYYYPNRLKLTNESEEEKPLLTEGRYDAITRKAVNDIMVVVKETANQLEFNQAVLPSGLGGDEEYTQEGMSFSIELNIHHQPLFNDRVVVKESDAYYVHTAVADEEDENVIMMTIVVDPAWEPKIYEKLFYKLQEDIRHEIEHLTQLGIHRISDRPTSRANTALLKTTFGHHKNKLEVPALVHGFYRRAKLEKRPLDEIMIEDLDSEIEKGNLTKRAAQSLLAIWIDYAKKNLPAAIYSQE